MQASRRLFFQRAATTKAHDTLRFIAGCNVVVGEELCVAAQLAGTCGVWTAVARTELLAAFTAMLTALNPAEEGIGAKCLIAADALHGPGTLLDSAEGGILLEALQRCALRHGTAVPTVASILRNLYEHSEGNDAASLLVNTLTPGGVGAKEYLRAAVERALEGDAGMVGKLCALCRFLEDGGDDALVHVLPMDALARLLLVLHVVVPDEGELLRRMAVRVGKCVEGSPWVLPRDMYFVSLLLVGLHGSGVGKDVVQTQSMLRKADGLCTVPPMDPAKLLAFRQHYTKDALRTLSSPAVIRAASVQSRFVVDVDDVARKAKVSRITELTFPLFPNVVWKGAVLVYPDTPAHLVSQVRGNGVRIFRLQQSVEKGVRVLASVQATLESGGERRLLLSEEVSAGTRWFTEPHPYTMSTMNMQEFQRDNFKPQDWINRELANVKPEALENNVNSLALRLQVLGNEVNTCFEDHIIQSLAKLPMCLVDLDRMSREVNQLSGALSNILTEDVIQRQQEAESATQSIAKLHQKKEKLDSCQDTLSQTVYLRENMHALDKSFAEGNTANIASEINKMQQALEAVRGFGQHDQLASSVASYEEKLQEMVEAECVDALINRDKDKAKEHLATLKKIGRLNEILVQYTKRAVQSVAKEWKDFEAAHPLDGEAWGDDLLQFMQGFNQRLENTLAASKRYYTDVFGDDASQVTLEYYTAVQRDTAHSQVRYLSKADLPVLVECHRNSAALLKSVIEAHFPPASDAEAQAGREAQIEMLKLAASGPFRHQQSVYPSLEETRLKTLVDGMRFVRDLANQQKNIKINPTMVLEITEGTSTLLHECQLAVERCIAFTSGETSTQAKTLELFATLNVVLGHFSSKILDVVLRLRVGLGLNEDDKGEKERSESPVAPVTDQDNVKLKLTLQLHHAAQGVGIKIGLFNTWLHDHVAGMKRDESTANLKKFVENAHTSADTAGEGGASIFAAATRTTQKLEKTVEAIVFDLLFSPVAARLANLHALQLYCEKSKNSYGYASPMDSLPIIGDYLLGLPEALSQASTGLENEDNSTWIVLIMKRTSDLFLEQVTRIPQLTPQGVLQLETDVGYISNVMGAFNLTVPALGALLIVLSGNEEAAVKQELEASFPGCVDLLDLIQAKRKSADTATTAQKQPQKTDPPTAKRD